MTLGIRAAVSLTRELGVDGYLKVAGPRLEGSRDTAHVRTIEPALSAASVE
jgi:hypothetical protein